MVPDGGAKSGGVKSAAIGLAACILWQSAAANPPSRDSGAEGGATPSQQTQRDRTPVSEAAAIHSDTQRLAAALEAKNAYDESANGQQDAHEAAKGALQAAGWAQGMFWVAFAETLITGAGLLVVALNLKEARRSADASERSVKETRRIGGAQVRAYVNIIGCHVYFLRDGIRESDDRHPLVHVRIENTGQSPALNFRWISTLRYHESFGDGMKATWPIRMEDQIGVDIPSNRSTEDGEKIAGMETSKYLKGSTRSKVIVTSVDIDFTFDDVFGGNFRGSAFFGGPLYELREGAQEDTPYGNVDWKSELKAMAFPMHLSIGNS